MSSLGAKESPHGVLLTCEVKPSQRRDIVYRTWAVVGKEGSVLCGHCTFMAGLSKVCNHVGTLLYKCMQESSSASSLSCKLLPCQWLPARKTVFPTEITQVDFQRPKLDKC
jgi:hypothetical protein